MLNGEENNLKIRELIEKEAEDLAKVLAEKYNFPYLDLSIATIDLDALKLIPEEKSRAGRIVAFQKAGKKIQVAIQSPNLELSKNIVEELKREGFFPTLYIVSENGLKRAWKRYADVPEYTETSKGIVDVSSERLENFMSQAQSIEDLKKLFEETIATKTGRKISELLEIILAGAISVDASDIHLEPQEKDIRLRFRLDGILHDIFSFGLEIYNLLLSRIKLVSELKLNVHDQAQDGRFSIKIKDATIEVRISVIPENYGESIVMRILNPKSISISFEELGIEKKLLEIISHEVEKPNGMIVTTGPTGAGKTTTLYAFLNKISSSEIKIITLEDPVEYHLPGIIQTQVEEDKGYTFANGLKSIVRQDPDVIMVGEIRDLDTAKIAINAALTGHLVLSTIHANNAAATIPRFIDLGVNPNAIAPAINIAIAQRLVRKLCPACKAKYKPDQKEKESIEKILKSIPKDYPLPKEAKEFNLFKAKGCSECNGIGYKKRIGIFEAILIDEKMERVILEKQNETDIIEASKDQGILNMTQDGILKVLRGITSLEELKRQIEL